MVGKSLDLGLPLTYRMNSRESESMILLKQNVNLDGLKATYAELTSK